MTQSRDRGPSRSPAHDAGTTTESAAEKRRQSSRRATTAKSLAPGALAVGVYRFWRDIGFAVGAVLLADACGMTTAILVVAAITAASGYEQRPAP